MSIGFDARALERNFHFIDGCPDDVFDSVATFLDGTLEERFEGIRRWHDALLAGRLPPEDGWPPPEIGAPARLALQELGIVHFCKDQPELVNALLNDLLASFIRQNEVISAEVKTRLRELEALERARLLARAKTLKKRKQNRKPLRREYRLSRKTLSRLRRQAREEVARRHINVDPELIAAWRDLAVVWHELAEVFGELGMLIGFGWDLAQGVLHRTGWQDLLQLRKLLEGLPELRAIIRSLGRLHASDVEKSVAERIFVPVLRLQEELREVRTPLVAAETRGVERGAEIARMLPVEAQMLGHPKLRLVWHARRAERALLTYRVEGIELESSLVETQGTEEQDHRRPRPERGPILVVLDTSGSMSGTPERVAKAIALEAARTAHREGRQCFLYAYSGPGDVLEHELDLTPSGLGRLLAFLEFSFNGGTDVEVMETVVRRLEQEAWKKADVILVSDGLWNANSGVRKAVCGAKEKGTRFHGVQVGQRGQSGMHTICDPVHQFSEWTTIEFAPG